MVGSHDFVLKHLEPPPISGTGDARHFKSTDCPRQVDLTTSRGVWWCWHAEGAAL